MSLRSFVTGAGKGRSTGRQRAEAARDIQRQVTRLAKATGLTETEVRDAAQAYHQAVQRQKADAPARRASGHAPSFAEFVKGWGRGTPRRVVFAESTGEGSTDPKKPSPVDKYKRPLPKTKSHGGMSTGKNAPQMPINMVAAYDGKSMELVGPLKELMAKLGVVDHENHVFTLEQVEHLQRILLKPNPVDASILTNSVWGNKTFPEAHMRGIVQEFVNMLPTSVAPKLLAAKLNITFVPELKNGAEGDCDGKNIRLSTAKLTDPKHLRRRMFHELSHWVHMSGPEWFRELITDLTIRRNDGYDGPMLVLYSKFGFPYEYHIRGIPDDWADVTGYQYAGRRYDWEDPDKPEGLEVAPVLLENLAYPPKRLTELINHRSDASGRHAWREALLTSLRILLEP